MQIREMNIRRTRINLHLARRWALLNGAAAVICMAVITIMSFAPSRGLNPRPPRYLFFIWLWLFALIFMGAAQAITCCWLASFVRTRNKAMQVAIALLFGIVTAILIPVLAIAITGLGEMVLACWILLPSAIIFGPILGLAQWRSLRSTY